MDRICPEPLKPAHKPGKLFREVVRDEPAHAPLLQREYVFDPELIEPALQQPLEIKGAGARPEHESCERHLADPPAAHELRGARPAGLKNVHERFAPEPLGERGIAGAQHEVEQHRGLCGEVARAPRNVGARGHHQVPGEIEVRPHLVGLEPGVTHPNGAAERHRFRVVEVQPAGPCARDKLAVRVKQHRPTVDAVRKLSNHRGRPAPPRDLGEHARAGRDKPVRRRPVVGEQCDEPEVQRLARECRPEHRAHAMLGKQGAKLGAVCIGHKHRVRGHRCDLAAAPEAFPERLRRPRNESGELGARDHNVFAHPGNALAGGVRGHAVVDIHASHDPGDGPHIKAHGPECTKCRNTGPKITLWLSDSVTQGSLRSPGRTSRNREHTPMEEEAMKAVVFRDTATRVAVADVTLAPPKAGEVRVKIAAAGVCHSDLHVKRGEWTAPAPMVMGHEGSGVVVELGEGVTSLAVGDHVVLSWVPPCGECRYCLQGHEARCQKVAQVINAKGSLFDGTSRLSIEGEGDSAEPLHHYLGVSSFAEEVVVPASGAIKVRDDAPLDVIAVVGCAVATGVGAVMNTAAVEPGSTVAVIGCGGVGLNVVQGAKLAGAERIIAIDVVAEKTDMAMQFGATDRIDASDRDAVEQLLEILPDGVDYAFDAIGRTVTTEQAIKMLGLGGAAVIVGLPPTGAKASFEPLVLAEADQRILGSNYGSVRPSIDIPALVDRYMDGQLKLDPLISGRRSLDDAAEALDDLASGGVLRTLLIP